MKFIDFFSGIGGFRLGMEMASHQCVGYVEWDKFARKSYEAIYNTEGEWTWDDVSTIDYRQLPGADCWCFGFPCTDISLAGPQTGFRGNRSSLYFAVTKRLRQIKEWNPERMPSILFIENVKNFLSINRGWDFLAAQIELDEIGYDCEWQVLDSKDFGVPQHRERVFIIGHLRGKRRCEVFPIRGENSIHSSIIEVAKVKQHRHSSTMNSVLDPSGICPALDTMQGGNREPKVLDFSQVGREGGPRVYEGFSPTLGARDYKDPRCVDDGRAIRKLTPRECWRLQGFPDWAFDRAAKVNSSSQLYKQAGNSVTVNVIYEIARRLN